MLVSALARVLLESEFLAEPVSILDKIIADFVNVLSDLAESVSGFVTAVFAMSVCDATAVWEVVAVCEEAGMTGWGGCTQATSQRNTVRTVVERPCVCAFVSVFISTKYQT